MPIRAENILSALSGDLGKEDFLTLLESESVKVERIVSHASSSPENVWYDQSYSEWVFLVRGQATLQFESGQRIELEEGDYLTIPPHARHKVRQTGPETVWLVVHLKEAAGRET
ncbi:MAG: cupin domain-containing protein [Deltaproteobacteria bacterium]|nr:cupin domain-containing protein [Deltaproteobacteria bacterium]